MPSNISASGFEFLEALDILAGTTAERPICCILTSVSDQKELNRLRQRPGVHGMLNKPLNTKELEQILQALNTA